ncbi:hypothetical protein AA313_de0207824 [Arthrobotrys entomopaga]|nr:hypothetical protein AA313_de0207824 [Arthrobotrys entomopaga]
MAAAVISISISISARFQATQQIKSKISQSNPALSPSETLNLAKETEKLFAKIASSEVHYQSLVAEFKPQSQDNNNNNVHDDPSASNDKSSSDDVNPSIWSLEEEEEAKVQEEQNNISGIAFGRFRNCIEHSVGGASAIFRSKDPTTHEAVALKVTTTWVQPHDAYREARLLKRLGSDESHVLRLLEAETLRSQFILVLPFYPLTLADLLDKGENSTRLPRIFKHVAMALSFIHAKGVIHRDLKPANILLKSPNGPACLCDFGTAWATDDHHPDEPSNKKVIEIGTTCYRPPETLFGYRSYGSEVDIWAFGCVIAEAENGRPLFDAGELGTDLRLILSIFESLGTPTLKSWPEAENLPDFGKMLFNDFPARSWESLLPNAHSTAVDLVGNMVTYSQHRRFSADQVLQHSYLE